MLALHSLVDRAFRLFYVLAAVIVVLFLSRWNSQRKRLRKLGSKAPAVPSRAPLGTVAKNPASHVQKLRKLHFAGIDLLVTAINKLVNNDFFAWSREILDNPGRTVSLNMLGVNVLVTDEPENTKAVLSTKVSWCDAASTNLTDILSSPILAKEKPSTKSGETLCLILFSLV